MATIEDKCVAIQTVQSLVNKLRTYEYVVSLKDFERWKQVLQYLLNSTPIVHAHWIPETGKRGKIKNYKCSFCKQLGGGKYANLGRFCLNCGARMENENDGKMV